jgi:hypothetical protein
MELSKRYYLANVSRYREYCRAYDSLLEVAGKVQRIYESPPSFP